MTNSPFTRIPFPLLEREEFRRIVETLLQGETVSLDGIWGGACALAASAIARQACRPVLVVLAASEQIDVTASDIAFFHGRMPRTFPPLENIETRDSALESPLPVGDDLFGQRIRLLKSLTAVRNDSKRDGSAKTTAGENGSEVIVTSISAMLQPVPSPEMLRERTRTLEVETEIEIEPLIRWLVEGGYHATSAIELPGELAHRGHLLDIFAPDWDQPIRIEFFGDEIESIRRFDPATQRSLESVQHLELTRLRNGETFESSLADYLDPQTLVLFFEPEEIDKAGRLYLERLQTTLEIEKEGETRENDNGTNGQNDNKDVTIANTGDFVGSPLDHAKRAERKRARWIRNRMGERFFVTAEIFRRLMRFPFCTLSNLATGPAELNIRLPLSSVERLCGSMQAIREELDKLATERVHIICPTESEIERLRDLFTDTLPGREDRLVFHRGLLSSGFCITNDAKGLAPEIFVGSGQLFARHDIRRMPRRRLGQVIDSFLDLNSGDLVVHLSHGIARYRGLTILTKGRQEEEHLHLEFAGGAAIYVPVSKISLVQKYVGGAKSKPQLAKLGGQAWTRQKKAVQAAVFDLAAEMIDIQAARNTQPGIAFPPDSDWQRIFDAAFPYKETDDQITAIEAIKQDMGLPRPMDRLLCGDVGFGKTEVAMRAVFKAVDAGYQVAILVPTTILAEQHFRTLSERLREFPFTIAAMSRFQSKKEQAEIVERLATGGIDIVVGTHRIASDDIRFHNLGLVIIDEEQRFGVAHKEKLKRLRNLVDVLTMTATPIPRTLHFSLLGIRDISNLETPPEDRMAVETKLVRYDPELIRTAVLRELNRGGQVFFVHNKVLDIEDVAAKLTRIVPEARIGIGHAQMPDDALEEVMLDFVEHRFDILVATTIIESGLDIPNANTIFIDAADRYGLAELHQLRGRVGRYKHQAYCYLLLDANQPLTDIAGKRLRAIEEFSHLGAGFNIAMRDLEIRGAGNILGTQQSGHIATVGYEMYCSFLEAAVRVLKRMPPKTVVEVELDLPGSAYIPKKYIGSQRQKIDIYRRLTRITTLEDVEDLENELEDRFGSPPLTVRRLLRHASIRVKAHALRVRAVRLEKAISGDPNVDSGGGYVVLDFVSRELMDDLKTRLLPTRLRLTDDGKAYVPLPKELEGPTGPPDPILQFVDDILIDPS